MVGEFPFRLPPVARKCSDLSPPFFLRHNRRCEDVYYWVFSLSDSSSALWFRQVGVTSGFPPSINSEGSPRPSFAGDAIWYIFPSPAPAVITVGAPFRVAFLTLCSSSPCAGRTALLPGVRRPLQPSFWLCCGCYCPCTLSVATSCAVFKRTQLPQSRPLAEFRLNASSTPLHQCKLPVEFCSAIYPSS